MYGFTEKFERAVAWCSCSSRQFYYAITQHLRLEEVADKPSHNILRAVLEIAKDTGEPPASDMIVLQRLQRWVQDGKFAPSECSKAHDVLGDLAFDPPDADVIAAEATDPVKRHLAQEVAREAVKAFTTTKSGDVDFAKSKALMLAVEQVGQVAKTASHGLSLDSLDAIANAGSGICFSTGVPELDVALHGGLRQSTLGIFCADTKAGKSQFLTHVTCENLRCGLFVAYATFENSWAMCLARVIANLTSVPINTVMYERNDPTLVKRWKETQPTIGMLEVNNFTPKFSNTSMIAEWLDEIESIKGRKVDLLVVDYVDKMAANNRALRGEYEVQGAATEDLRTLVAGRSIGGWSASQAQRPDSRDKTSKKDLNNLADSQGKARVADLIITAWLPTKEEVMLMVAGHRNGEQGQEIGPLVHNFSMAQFVPIGYAAP